MSSIVQYLLIFWAQRKFRIALVATINLTFKFVQLPCITKISLCVKPVAALYALCLLFIQINVLKTLHAYVF